MARTLFRVGGTDGIFLPAAFPTRAMAFPAPSAATLVTQSSLSLAVHAVAAPPPTPAHTHTAWFVNAGPFMERPRRGTGTRLAAPEENGVTGAATDWMPITDPDGIVLNFSAKYRDTLAARMAEIAARRTVLMQPTPPLSLGGAIVTAFPSLPSVEALTARCAALRDGGTDLDVAAYYLAMIPDTEETDRARACQCAAWAALQAIETADATWRHIYQTAADRIGALAEAEAPPARRAADRVFYAAIAAWWPTTTAHGEPHPVRRAWDRYLTALTTINESTVEPTPKQWRALEEIERQITHALSREGAELARSLAEHQRRNVEYLGALDAPRLAGEARRRSDPFAETAAELARYYFAAEARLLRTERPITDRRLKPLGHTWERLARALLVGTCPEAVEGIRAQIVAFETAEQCLMTWGGTIPPDRTGEWHLRRFLPVAWQRYAEVFFLRSTTPELLEATHQRALANQWYTDWIAALPDTQRETLAGDHFDDTLFHWTHSWAHCVEALESGAPLVARGYEKAARLCERAVRWAAGRGIDTRDVTNYGYWNALYSVQKAWFEAASAHKANRPWEAEYWTEAAETQEEDLPAWTARSDITMQDIQSDLYYSALYSASIAWRHAAEFAVAGMHEQADVNRRLAKANQTWAARLLQRGYEANASRTAERNDPFFRRVLGLYNAKVRYTDRQARTEWLTFVAQTEADILWYQTHAVDDRVPAADQGAWKARQTAAAAEWRRLMQLYPPPPNPKQLREA